MNSKICIKCNEDKNLDEFFSGNTKKSKNKCKKCLKFQDKEYYEKNKENILNIRKDNYDPLKQQLIYEKHKDKQKISRNKYRSNPIINEKINEQKKEYRKRPEVKEYIRRKNKEYLPIKLEKLKEKRKNDKGYKLSENIKNHINRIFKSQDINKPTKQIIGISSKFLIKWIEFQFDDWMTWENYGEWHLDHIIPMSLFDKNNIKDIKICFHWTNYQPLKGIDNMSKKNKIVLHHNMNSVINVHRFINKYKIDFNGYQIVNESLQWLRIHLDGKNSIDDN